MLSDKENIDNDGRRTEGLVDLQYDISTVMKYRGSSPLLVHSREFQQPGS